MTNVIISDIPPDFQWILELIERHFLQAKYSFVLQPCFSNMKVFAAICVFVSVFRISGSVYEIQT